MGKKKKTIKAKLIVNPDSGSTNDPSARLEEVTRCLLDHGIKVSVALAHPKEAATTIARKAVKKGYKLVIAMGGDGTIEAVARGLVGRKTRLGIFPAGTANNIVKSLGIPEEMNAACELIRAKKTRKIDMGRVKTRDHGKFYFFELASVGLAADLYPVSKKIPKGSLEAVKDTAEKLLAFKSPEVYLTMDGESQLGKINTMLVAVSNTPAWGMNFLMAPGASMEDGLLDVSVYPNFNKAELLAHLAKVMDANAASDDKVQRYRVKKIKIKTKPAMEVMADGEMLGCTLARIRVMPGILRVIAPPGDHGLAQKPEAAGERLPAPVSPVSKERQADEGDNRVKAEEDRQKKEDKAEGTKEEIEAANK